MENCNNINSIKLIGPRLSLSLFMLSRNRIKFTKLCELRKYIKKNITLYCQSIETVKNSVCTKKYVCPFKKAKYSKYSLKNTTASIKNSWQLPPNLYDTIKIPYVRKRGASGAYWSKIHIDVQVKSHSNIQKPLARFYNIPSITEKLFATCQRQKGVFLSNARHRQVTTRCMVSNAGTCHRNPSEPGPTSYNIVRKEHVSSISWKKPTPYLFYRLSSVPVTNNDIHKLNTSFTGAPGRYDIRYSNICPCSSKLIYQPQLYLIIENEKRKKFRRLSYEKIKSKLYTSPDWRHVTGRGFRYLFKGAKPYKSITLSNQGHNKLKNLQLYPDSKYIAMINNPVRTPLSVRSEQILNFLPKIKFNSIAKKITRKQLRNNKKIAFNSSQDRFRDSYRHPIITNKQIEEIKKSLPIERQFRDNPIMEKRVSQIKSKLYETPKHMLPNYEPKLRKKIFKFQPLPQAKVLVTEKDTNFIESSEDGYFLKKLKANIFFRDDVK